MPELPEVETVRRGLAPFLEGARIEGVTLNRPDLRFPFPAGFDAALTGRTVEGVDRRAKYLLFRLTGELTWLTHLGMTGSFRFLEPVLAPSGRYYLPPAGAAHEHVLIRLLHPVHGALTLIYADARRFGFMDLFEGDRSPFLLGLGPEPLADSFDPARLAGRLSRKSTPIKAALLDQRVVAGLGNIYVSEALFRAGIRPDRPAGQLVTPTGRPTRPLAALVAAIKTVLGEAIEDGGSTLRDFRQADGAAGAFQHRFAVYDRAGEPCLAPDCTGTVERIVQGGRSSFFCPVCQPR